MPSAIRQLLDEISWEGNASEYRHGGLGLENVLTAEVFQALNFLPREQFLRQVFRSARGATTGCQIAATHAEESTVEILPGDFLHAEYGFKAQPDAVPLAG